MTVAELIEELRVLPSDASVYVDLQQVDCLGVEAVDVEDDDGDVTVYLVVSV
jgi:hypothetical protein